MNYIDIIGKPLKCDFLNDLFETYDVDVIYVYDRTNESIEDQYRVEIPQMGLEFLFDSSQRLKALFMEQVTHNGFNPFEGVDPRHVGFSSGAEALKYATEIGIEAVHQEQKNHSLYGEIPEYVKFDYGAYYIHYQFKGDKVNKVTLLMKDI